MINWLSRMANPPKEKRVAIIDGDQGINFNLSAYRKYVPLGTETLFVVHQGNIPVKRMNRLAGMRIVPVNAPYGKEGVDKCIGCLMEQKIVRGYTHVDVISSDHGFVDMFNILIDIEPAAECVKFRLIKPTSQGRQIKSTDQIQIIKHQVRGAGA